MKALDFFTNGKRSLIDLAILCLQITVALGSIGYASQAFRQKLEINTEVLIGWGTSPYIANIIPALMGAAFLVLAVLVLWKPTPKVIWSTFTLILLLTVLKTFQGNGFASSLAIPSRATRFLAPVALLMLMEWRKDRSTSFMATLNIMRIALALTFVGHGVKVLFHGKSYFHLLGSSQVNLLGTQIFSPEVTVFLLDSIAVLDITVAILVLVTRWQALPLYMAAWTFITATSRVTANGLVAWDDIPIRGAYYGTAIAIFLLYQWLKANPEEDESTSVNLNLAPQPVSIMGGDD